MKKHSLKKQKGTTLFLLMAFFVGLFVAVALATDGGHLFVNKTRLQNAMDATALSAAIVLNNDVNRNTANATIKGKDTFDLYKNLPGNSELSDIDRNQLTFQYSKHLIDPITGVWTPGTTPPAFVRVSTNAHDVEPIYIQVLSAFTNAINVYAVSTAGAIGQNCQVTPFVLCADMPVYDAAKGDEYCLDPSHSAEAYCQPIDADCDADDDDTFEDGDGIAECYGYETGEIRSLIVACNGTGCNQDELESGNYNLLNLDTLQGGKDIKEAIEDQEGVDSDDFNACSSKVLNTKPGYTWGNVRAGINNRFDSDTDTTQYCNTDTSSPSCPAWVAPPSPYKDYSDNGNGNNRRLIATVLGDCRGLQNGNSFLPNVGNACVFLTQHAFADGSAKKIMMEFVTSCPQVGNIDALNSAINGPFKVVLFKSEGGRDS